MSERSERMKVASDALLGFGWYVVEVEQRRKDGTLVWQPRGGFPIEGDADSCCRQWNRLANARVIKPNARSEADNAR